MSDTWTNPSVRRFANDEDPVDAIVQHARRVAFDAAAEGWSGPPFDPLALARILGHRVAARDSLTDARVVFDDDGAVIEYNPLQPRGRLRFSIAHEIAHTFFEDARDAPRHRSGSGAVATDQADDWQLELLCNVAAAELLMPNLALPFSELDASQLDIDAIMKLRAEYDVSTEAILRRVVSGTNHQVSCVATARVTDSVGGSPRFRVDYATSSRTWVPPVVRAQELSWATLAACTAVGYTWKSTETIDEGTPVSVQAVGAPPYPGRQFPRVIALVQPTEDRPTAWSQISYVTGDATEPPDSDRPGMIVHVVNDGSRAWGRFGFAGQLATKYPRNASAFRNWTLARPDNLRLGNAHILECGDRLSIASVVAQEGFGPSDTPRLRYSGLRDGLKAVREEAIRAGAAVHMPRIGTGQAGGQWELVAEVVDEELCVHGVDVFVYTPPEASSRSDRRGAHR